MTQTNLRSIHTADASADWPENAVPKHWIDSLFSKMAAYYGARFADAWKGTNLSQVQKAWAVELRKLTNAELKAGVEKLVMRMFPPTLPEFIALCRVEKPEAVDPSHVLYLEAPRPPVDMQKVNASVRFASEALAKVKPNGPEWAFRMLSQGKTDSGKALPIGVIDVYKRAILSPAGTAFMQSPEGKQYVDLYRTVRQQAGIAA